MVSQLSHVRFPSSAEVSVPRGGFPQAILSVKAHELELELASPLGHGRIKVHDVCLSDCLFQIAEQILVKTASEL